MGFNSVFKGLNAHCVGQKTAAAQSLEGCIRVTIMPYQQQ